MMGCVSVGPRILVMVCYGLIFAVWLAGLVAGMSVASEGVAHPP